MAFILTAFVGALAGAIVSPLIAANVEIRRHDQRVAERDDDLDEWLVARHRKFRRRLNELRQDMAARGVAEGGAPIQARRKVGTIALYDYREALRQARADRARVMAEEGWNHHVMRLLRRRPRPQLKTPERRETRILIDHWGEGTEANALTWSLGDIARELGGSDEVKSDIRRVGRR